MDGKLVAERMGGRGMSASKRRSGRPRKLEAPTMLQLRVSTEQIERYRLRAGQVPLAAWVRSVLDRECGR